MRINKTASCTKCSAPIKESIRKSPGEYKHKAVSGSRKTATDIKKAISDFMEEYYIDQTTSYADELVASVNAGKLYEGRAVERLSQFIIHSLQDKEVGKQKWAIPELEGAPEHTIYGPIKQYAKEFLKKVHDNTPATRMASSTSGVKVYEYYLDKDTWDDNAKFVDWFKNNLSGGDNRSLYYINVKTRKGNVWGILSDSDNHVEITSNAKAEKLVAERTLILLKNGVATLPRKLQSLASEFINAVEEELGGSDVKTSGRNKKCSSCNKPIQRTHKATVWSEDDVPVRINPGKRSLPKMETPEEVRELVAKFTEDTMFDEKAADLSEDVYNRRMSREQAIKELAKYIDMQLELDHIGVLNTDALNAEIKRQARLIFNDVNHEITKDLMDGYDAPERDHNDFGPHYAKTKKVAFDDREIREAIEDFINSNRQNDEFENLAAVVAGDVQSGDLKYKAAVDELFNYIWNKTKGGDAIKSLKGSRNIGIDRVMRNIAEWYLKDAIERVADAPERDHHDFGPHYARTKKVALNARDKMTSFNELWNKAQSIYNSVLFDISDRDIPRSAIDTSLLTNVRRDIRKALQTGSGNILALDTALNAAHKKAIDTIRAYGGADWGSSDYHHFIDNAKLIKMVNSAINGQDNDVLDLNSVLSDYTLTRYQLKHVMDRSGLSDRYISITGKAPSWGYRGMFNE